MRLVERTDVNGYKRLTWVKNGDLDDATGISADPPDLDQLDWEQLKKNLHNMLVEKRLLSWQDVQRSQNGISSTIVSVFKRELIALYRSVENG